MTAKQAQDFTNNKPVAKKKLDGKIGDDITEKTATTKKVSSQSYDDRNLGVGKSVAWQQRPWLASTLKSGQACRLTTKMAALK